MRPISRIIYKSLILLLTATQVILWNGQISWANQLSERSLSVSSAVPLASVSDDFKFNLASTTTLGSIKFLYCSNSPLLNDSCSAPAGLNLSNASLSYQSGNQGFSTAPTITSNSIIISRVPAPALSVKSEYIFTNVINPSTANQTVYVRITTYASSDASGSYSDNGSVAFALTSPFEVGAYVAPFLNLCADVTVASNCAYESGENINLGDLSSHKSAGATSQIAASTNSPSGYALYILGSTMTSGNNIISPNVNASPSQVGVNQFGLNLRKNSQPNEGSDPSGKGSASPTFNYDQPNLYTFNDGDEIAGSNLPTDFNLFTASYVVNVSPAQPPGYYATSLTFLAAAQF